jgi:C1A family cysteine protease
MHRIAIAVVCLCLSCVTLSAFAGDRQPTAQELERIEEIRRTIRENGYTWQAGVTSVSHLSPEEFDALLGLKIPPDYEARRERARREGRMVEVLPNMSFPPNFDWRSQGGVTPVKNQGSCGSCWAFCAAGAMESQVLIRSGLETDISEQAVLSCNAAGDGCDGGWMSTAYDLWIDHGAVAEECMPYHAVDTDACIQGSCDVLATLDGYYYVGENIDDIKQAVLDGPVAVAIAVCGGFGSYTGGCYDETCSEINHGVVIVGWDDTMCGDGAWIIKNSWGPDWGVNGYMYIKYGACSVGYGAEALTYTPGQTVHFFHDSHLIDDSAGDGDGNIETGELIVLPVTLLNIGAETATNVGCELEVLTAGVTLVDSLADCPDIPKGETRQSDWPHLSFTVSPGGPSCGAIDLHLTVTSDQGTSHMNLTVQAGEIITVFSDDFETDQGWTVGAPGDAATTGIWERGDPEGTWWGDQPVQPEDDHSTTGTFCYVTAVSSGASQGSYDVDGGKTTLTSPTIDLSDKDSAVLTYCRWYASDTGSNPNDDDLVVDASDDDGGTWHNLETRECADRNWTPMEFYLEDYIALTGQVKFRVVAQDNGVGGSIVEAGIDDFVIKACEESAADVEAPTVTVVAPDGGEVWQYDNTYDILWTASDNVAVISITILLSTDGGSTFPDTIATGEANDGSYAWAVPDVDSRTARIRVIALDAASNEGSDASDADFWLWGTISGADIPGIKEVPAAVVLGVSSSNPTASSARIVFGLPAASYVDLGVYDVTGRLVRALLGDNRAGGYHTIDWNGEGRLGSRVSPGIYFVRLDCDLGQRTTKVVIAK